MNEFTPINIVLTLCNIILVCVGVYTALKTIRHFQQKNLYDQWLLALSDNYQNHFQNVQMLFEKPTISVVDEINKNDELRKSVNYVLDWWIIKAIGIRYNFRELLTKRVKKKMISIQEMEVFHELY